MRLFSRFFRPLSLRRQQQLSWARRGVAALCLASAALTATHHHRQNTATLKDVLVASHSLQAGTTLTEGDLRVAHWPAATSPPLALSNAQAVGRRLTSDVSVGEAITSTRVLLDDDLAAQVSPGLSATSITVTGPSGLLHKGNHVDLLTAATSSAGAETTTSGGVVLAEDVVVLAVLPATSTSGLTQSNGAGATDGQLELIVAVSRAAALRLAASSGLPVLATVRAGP